MPPSSVSVVIPARNEAWRIRPTVIGARRCACEVVVVDDSSADDTATIAEAADARVARQEKSGYVAAIKRGFRETHGEIVVTMEADGEHYAVEIPRLVDPISRNETDLVLGVRPRITRPSERLLNWLTGFGVEVSDSGTGFRALRKDLAVKLRLNGRCICGISELETAALGAGIAEVPIELNEVDKRRRVAWYHVLQTWLVMRWMISLKGRRA